MSTLANDNECSLNRNHDDRTHMIILLYTSSTDTATANTTIEFFFVIIVSLP